MGKDLNVCWGVLGAFAKLLKAIISFFTSVRLTAWTKMASTGRIFKKFGI